MKRRTFLTALSALAAAPALPAAAAPAGAQITQHFATAKLLARCHDRASPGMLARLMKLDADTAQGVYRLLQDRNVIAGGLDGIARATSPLNTHCIPTGATRLRDLMQGTPGLKNRLKKFARQKWDDIDTPDDTTEPTT